MMLFKQMSDYHKTHISKITTNLTKSHYTNSPFSILLIHVITTLSFDEYSNQEELIKQHQAQIESLKKKIDEITKERK